MQLNDLAVVQTGDNVYIDIDSGASTSYYEGALRFRHGSVTRFAIEKDNVANADLYIRRYNSSGVLQDSPIKISGDTGLITIHRDASTAGSLKVHNHQMASGVEYANEFKGEFLSTSGTMDGIAAHFNMSASGTGVLRSIIGVAYLDTGITLSGTSATGSWINGILGSVNVAGVINGTAVTVTGVYGGLGSMTGGTLTACKYMSAIWADSQVTQVPSSGQSQLILMTNGLGGTLNQAIYLDANDRISEFAHFANCAVMISAKTDADVAYAHYRKLLVTVDSLPGWIYIEMAA